MINPRCVVEQMNSRGEMHHPDLVVVESSPDNVKAFREVMCVRTGIRAGPILRG